MPASALLLDPDLYDAQDLLGRYQVSEEKLKERLGKTSWDVWLALCHFRCKRTGMMHALRSTISDHQELSTRQVKRAIRTLIFAGLVIDYKRKEIPVMVTIGGRQVKRRITVPMKIVYGVRAVAPGENKVFVPTTTANWLTKKRGWGGIRFGAGRPKVPNSRRSQKEVAEIKIGPTTPLYRNQDGSTDIYIYNTDSTANEFFLKEKLVRESARDSSILKADFQQTLATEIVLAESTPSSSFPSGQIETTPPGFIEESIGAGMKLKGGGPGGPTIPPPGHGGVPRYPGPLIVPPAIVPNPPLLPDGLSGKDAATWLLRAYRGCVESRYKKRCYVLVGKDIAKSRFFGVLVDAAKTLHDHEMSPAAWVAWSIDMWRRDHKRKIVPGLAWVFSQKRIADREGWFKHEDGGYSESRAIYSPFAQELLQRYSGMQSELRRVGAASEEEVTPVVQRWFPGNLYDELVSKARERSAEDQQLMNVRVKRGDFIW